MEPQIDLSYNERQELSASKYYNSYLAPTSPKERNWTAYNVCMCWIAMNVCIPAYQMASSAIAFGLSWWVSILLVLIGNLIIFIPIYLNSKVGTKYGIPFPVYSRISFGIRGAHFPNILRAIIGAAWTGILTWTGSEAIQVALEPIFPAGVGFKYYSPIICFVFFLVLNISIAYSGIKVFKKLKNFGAPVLALVCIGLVVWAAIASIQAGHSVLSPLTTLKTNTSANLTTTIFTFLVANICFYSTWALNIPDLSRYTKSSKSQFTGQLIGLPFSMLAIAFVGIYVTGASKLLFGEPMWNPVDIIRQFNNTAITIIAAIAIMFATLTTNVTTNILPPSNVFSNLWPKRISYKTGVLITGVIAIAIRPWALISNPNAYIYDWLATYGILTGPLAGIYIYDYFVLRKQKIDLIYLYKRLDSKYWYSSGFNIKAFIAWGGAILLPLLGKLIPALKDFAVYGWIFGFVMGPLIYALLSKNYCNKKTVKSK